MKKIAINILVFLISYHLYAQDNILPALPNSGTIVIVNGTIHTGTGKVIEKGSILIKGAKIEKISDQPITVENAEVVDASGLHIYPGMILPTSDLGIKEIENGVRGSNDSYELGDMNPNIESIVAYNADSRIINPLRCNGVLLANVVPEGNFLAGTSSVVQLDAWTWEDAIYKKNVGMHLYMPTLMPSPRRGFGSVRETTSDPMKEGLQALKNLQDYFTQAKAYFEQKPIVQTNLKFEALKELFAKRQKLFIHANNVRQILAAIDFKKNYDLEVVIVGGSESYRVASILREYNIPVVLRSLHNLPTLEDDDIDIVFKTPAILKKEGVLFALNDDLTSAKYKNLPFNAGSAIAYGLDKEDALQAITLHAAKILGIDALTGSIEVGKDANIIICNGDLFDMTSSNVKLAYIQGRKINLENKHTQLFERYRNRYGIKN